MKKHDEGYVLVLVLVVVIVLCLVASAILSGALYNINSQHAQIEKMKEQYAAEGEIEKVIASLENLPEDGSLASIFPEEGAKCTFGEFHELERKLILTIEAAEGDTKVICVLELTGSNITEETVGDEKNYTVVNPEYKYISFDVEPIDSEEVPE